MDRSFLNALERWLEPLDEDFDEEGDECDLAEMHKQEQRDREDYLAETYRQRKEKQNEP